MGVALFSGLLFYLLYSTPSLDPEKPISSSHGSLEKPQSEITDPASARLSGAQRVSQASSGSPRYTRFPAQERPVFQQHNNQPTKKHLERKARKPILSTADLPKGSLRSKIESLSQVARMRAFTTLSNTNLPLDIHI